MHAWHRVARRGGGAGLRLAALGLLFAVSGAALAGKPPSTPPTIAFAFLKENRLNVSDLSGSYVVALSQNSTDRHPAWSPDGAWIVYGEGVDSLSTEEDLYRIRPDGTGRELLGSFREGGAYLGPKHDARPAWLPAGDRILYSTFYPDVVAAFDLATRTVQSIPWPFTDDNENPNYIALGPDMDEATPGYEGWMAYTYNCSQPAFDYDVAVVYLTQDPATGLLSVDASSRQIYARPTWQKFPAFSPDGTRIAFVDDAIGWEGTRLSVVGFDPVAGAFDASEPLVLCEAGSGTSRSVWKQPTWSPDGTQIAFALRMTTGAYAMDVYRVPTNQGSNPALTPVVASRKQENHPAWRPTP